MGSDLRRFPDRAPSNVSARNLSATELLVKWEPLPKESYHSVLLAYRINISKIEINFTRIINVPPNTTNHRITGLDTYTRYVVSVAAVNDVGQGVYSDDVIVWTEEGVPSHAPNISEIFYTSSTSIRVTWEPLSPHFVQGRLLGYRVVYRQVDGENWEKWKAITTGNKEHGTSITGLKKYGAYVVQVGAFTRKGNGLLSKGYMLRTDEDVPSKPPQNLTVAKDNSTSTSLFIHWRPVPANHQNGIILGYRIMYKKSASEDTLKTKNVSARTTATELKNLTKFTEYSITILAYTSKGNGVRAKFFTASTTED
ncbi:neural cell adhesion molecule L1-like, partial [Porites lutea]|uniref:neural cell adhesion molecule L1-like n=1 Tax=Porites lutea TaxID=51062 RepID=UPI003CC61F49